MIVYYYACGHRQGKQTNTPKVVTTSPPKDIGQEGRTKDEDDGGGCEQTNWTLQKHVTR